MEWFIEKNLNNKNKRTLISMELVSRSFSHKSVWNSGRVLATYQLIDFRQPSYMHN